MCVCVLSLLSLPDSVLFDQVMLDDYRLLLPLTVKAQFCCTCYLFAVLLVIPWLCCSAYLQQAAFLCHMNGLLQLLLPSLN